MNPNLIAWFETIFNVIYLLVVWAVVIAMTHSMPGVNPKNKQVAGLVRVAFILLAAGDTGHVGFRVWAQLQGNVEAQVNVLGTPMSLVGLGMLTTSFTVTLFYMVMVYAWRMRYEEPANWLTNFLLAAGVFRLIFMALPGNEWGSVVPPQPMSIYRNIPLFFQGVGIIYLILSSAYKANDPVFKGIGWMIVVSYLFYTPVILFAQQVPLLGMLMIPKTCAYLAIAFIAYRGLWDRPGKSLAAGEA